MEDYVVGPVEQEIVNLLQIKQKSGESRRGFFRRMVRRVDKLSDDEWDLLSEPAAEWVNAFITAQRRRLPLPVPPGSTAPALQHDAKPKKGTRSAIRMTEIAAGRTARHRVYELLLENPSLSKTDLHEKLVLEGFALQIHTVGGWRTAFRKVTSFLTARGLFQWPQESQK